MTTDERLNGEGLIFQPTYVNLRVLSTHPLGIYSMATTWSMDISDYIESSNMLLVVLIGGTYSSRVNCTRVIAVGQH